MNTTFGSEVNPDQSLQEDLRAARAPSPFISPRSAVCVRARARARVCCGPLVTQLHNRFQFPSPACLLPGSSRPPPFSAACRAAALLGGPGHIRACQFRVLCPSQCTDLTEREGLAVSWWTFVPSRGIHNSGRGGQVRAEVTSA